VEQPRDRLIVALDLPSIDAAEAVIDRLGDSVTFYKIGYQLAFAGGLALAEKLIFKGRRVFVDLKLHDIGNTVEKGVESVARMGATFLTVHAYPQTMKAAVAGRGDSNLRILAVTDTYGRSLQFAHDGSGRLGTVTAPDGTVVTYGYDGSSRLATATYPGTVTRTYHYENATYPRALTGITDETGQRYATWTYDSQGRATSSEHGATNSGIDRHTVTYNANGSATITDPLNTQRTQNYATQFDVVKQAGNSQPGGAGCGAASQAVTYDANGFVASRTDFNGNLTTYVHNARGLETQRVEASGKPEQRTITTEWHASYRLPLRIAEPKKRTTYTYDPTGNLLTQTEQSTADATGTQGFAATLTGLPRTWTWTYNAQGQILTADGPRTDVTDRTTYTYHPLTDPDLGKRGNLATLTNALGHVTQIPAYDAAGRPLTVIDPNNVTTSLTYTPRGWLKTRTVDGKTTTWDYDAAGQLTRVTLPDGSHTDHHYDPAHRLTSITDTLGRAIDTTLDNAGNVTATAWQNMDASTAKSESAVMDALGRPQTRTDGRNQTTSQTFDAHGNLTATTDPKSQTTTRSWDALHRLTRLTDPLSGQTTLTWDGQGNLASLTAPNGALTSLTHDGLGNRSQETSADAGSSSATYDAAGNRLTRTDARGVVATFTHDALNRPLTVSYPATGENLTYTWDAGPGCSNGVGRLCQVTDPLGSTRYAYDPRGNRITETRIIGPLSLTTQTSYDAADRPIALTTPGGKLISLTRNGDGDIQSLAAPVAGTPVTLAQAIATNALGETTTQTYGNGVVETRQYDGAGDLATTSESNTGGGSGGGGGEEDVPTLPEWGALLLGSLLLFLGLKRRNGTASGGLPGGLAGLLAGLALASLLAGLPATPAQADETLTYDANGNIVSRSTEQGTTTYGYDALDRITSEAGPQKTQTLTYDGNGNRLSDGSGSHTYTANSDRQATQAGQAVTLDAAGHTTQARNLGFVWNQAGQLKEVRQTSPTGTLLATYDYDHRNRRIRKTTTAAAPQGAGTTIYLYDQFDRLLMEADGAGTPKVTYVWRDDVPTAVILAGPPETVLYLETDHLNTPRVARNQNKTIVWRWESDAFGSTPANEDPDNDGQKTTINLRFPGQYFDKESGLHYNWNRYYDPQLSGRYLSPDPIGLAGGTNLYTYVGGNPLSLIDPEGLSGRAPGKGPYPPGQGPGQETRLGGVEGHFFGGGGVTRVTCQDECGKWQTFTYIKVCFGGAIGAGASAGVVTNLGGKSCRKENYAGWFYEAGVSAGPISIGVDVGYNNDGPGGLPGSTSGVNEVGGGGGVGASVKSTWCYYIPL